MHLKISCIIKGKKSFLKRNANISINSTFELVACFIMIIERMDKSASYQTVYRQDHIAILKNNCQ